MGFIIRGKSGRKVLSADGLEEIRERLRNQAHPIQRDVMLSRRQTDGRQHHYQAREGRPARLEIGACRVDIRRSMRDPASLPVALTLNAVHVIEVNAPAGEQVVEWMLLTTEPIGTEEEICFVVDSYRARWVIEEYFKALKTGCGYEERQLESYDGLQRALAIYAVIAWRLLWARFLARSATSRPATDIGTPAELAVLVSQGRLTENASAEEFVMAVANLGGHIKRNGPPGWQVLWRGFRTLNAFAAGFAAASERSDQW